MGGWLEIKLEKWEGRKKKDKRHHNGFTEPSRTMVLGVAHSCHVNWCNLIAPLHAFIEMWLLLSFSLVFPI